LFLLINVSADTQRLKNEGSCLVSAMIGLFQLQPFPSQSDEQVSLRNQALSEEPRTNLADTDARVLLRRD